MKYNLNDKIIAIESFEKGVVREYGRGKLLENKIPNIKPFNEAKVKNPCIKLDNGKYVWGFQCWWTTVKSFNKQYKKYIIKKIIVEIKNEVLPLTSSDKEK